MSTELITINHSALSTIRDEKLKAALVSADKAAQAVSKAVMSVDSGLKSMAQDFGGIVRNQLYKADGYKHAKDLWEAIGVKESRASQLVGASRLANSPIWNQFNIDALYSLAASKVPVETIETAVKSGELPAWSGAKACKAWADAHKLPDGKPEVVKSYSVHVVLVEYGKPGIVTENDYKNLPRELFDSEITELAKLSLDEPKPVPGPDGWKALYYNSKGFDGHAVVYYRVPEKPEKAAKKSTSAQKAARLEEENARMRAVLEKAGIVI